MAYDSKFNLVLLAVFLAGFGWLFPPNLLPDRHARVEKTRKQAPYCGKAPWLGYIVRPQRA